MLWLIQSVCVCVCVLNHTHSLLQLHTQTVPVVPVPFGSWFHVFCVRVGLALEGEQVEL